MAEFLRTYQDIAAPIIEWGGLIVLLFMILSPFLIIRHKTFRPIRWWHVVGAYISSFLIFVILEAFLSRIDQWLTYRYLNSIELANAYDSAALKEVIWLLITYPLLIFYSAKLLYGTYTRRIFIITFGVFILFTAFFWVISAHIMLYYLGQALMNLN